MNSLATRCLALACIAAPAFAATPPTADQARTQLAEAVTCKRHLTPMRHNLDVQQFDGQTTIACSYNLR